MVKKSEVLNGVYEYKGDGELMSDISTTKPLKKVRKTKKTKKIKIPIEKNIEKNIGKVVEKVDEKIDEKIEEVLRELTDKEIFKRIAKSGEHFYLKYNGTIIYDSIKNKNSVLIFENDSFMLNGIKNLYKGLNLKMKK